MSGDAARDEVLREMRRDDWRDRVAQRHSAGVGVPGEIERAHAFAGERYAAAQRRHEGREPTRQDRDQAERDRRAGRINLHEERQR